VETALVTLLVSSAVERRVLGAKSKCQPKQDGGSNDG
jgi:hypothetical protein